MPSLCGLPNELLGYICTFASPKTLRRLARVSRRYRAIVQGCLHGWLETSGTLDALAVKSLADMKRMAALQKLASNVDMWCGRNWLSQIPIRGDTSFECFITAAVCVHSVQEYTDEPEATMSHAWLVSHLRALRVTRISMHDLECICAVDSYSLCRQGLEVVRRVRESFRNCLHCCEFFRLEVYEHMCLSILQSCDSLVTTHAKVLQKVDFINVLLRDAETLYRDEPDVFKQRLARCDLVDIVVNCANLYTVGEILQYLSDIIHGNTIAHPTYTNRPSWINDKAWARLTS